MEAGIVPAGLKKRRRAVETADEIALIADLPERDVSSMAGRGLVPGRTRGGATQKRRKSVYTEAEKRAVLAIYAAVGTKKKCVRLVQRKDGYELVREAHLRQWERTAAPRKRTGRPTFSEFETLVLSLLPADGKSRYADVRDAAARARSSPRWADDPRLARLRFSAAWVAGMMRRAAARRGVDQGDKQEGGASEGDGTAAAPSTPSVDSAQSPASRR